MRGIWVAFMPLLLVACQNKEGEDAVLTRAPFTQLTDSLKSYPRNAALYYRRGELLDQNNLPELAEQDFRKAWQVSPSENYALRLTAILEAKKKDSAVLFLQEAINKLPSSLVLRLQLARAYQEKGQTQRAMELADQILMQYPGQLDALTLKSEILEEQNDKKGALVYLEKAHSLVPSDPAVAYDLAYEYAEANDAKTLHLTDSLIKAKAPDLEKAYYVRGVYFSRTGKNTEALKSFDDCIRINYNFLDAYRDKAQILLDQKKYDSAVKTLNLSLKVAPANAFFYYLLAQAEEGLGRKADAKLNYQRAFGLDNSMKEAKEAAERL